MNSSSHSPGPKGYSAYVKDGEYKSRLKKLESIIMKTTGYTIIDKEEKTMIKLSEILDESLWANIRAKKKRGEKSDPRSKGYKAAKKAGQKLNKAAKKESVIYQSKQLGLEIVEHSEPVIFQEADYQGRKVALNKPMAGDVGKFKVYVKNPKGNVVKVNFGQKGVRIKKDNPDARRSFRARHKCDQDKPKTSAGYWSCRKW